MSATPLTLLKLCGCFLHDMRMCMLFAYNCCINFCQFSPFIYRLCEHIPYNTIPILCPLLKLMLHLCPPPPSAPPPPPPPPHTHPSIRQHLTWVSCARNSSYSFAPIVLKLCMCFPHGMRMCMWIGHNCWISFCHFFDIVNLVIFHPVYIDRGYLL